MEKPKQYVTVEELQKILAAYDRLGSAQTEAGKVEDRLRKFAQTVAEEKTLALHTTLKHEISTVTQKAALEAKTASQIVAQQVTVELHKTFDGLVRKLKESLLTDLTAYIKLRTDETHSQSMAKINAIADASEKKLVSQHLKTWNDLRDEQEAAKAAILAEAKKAATVVTEEAEKEISKETEAWVRLHTQNVGTIFEEFKIYLTEQLNLKLVDKQAIEQKMRDIESDLLKRATQIIDFNVQQARQQMETSARAEVKDGIKEAASQIIGSLGH